MSRQSPRARPRVLAWHPAQGVAPANRATQVRGPEGRDYRGRTKRGLLRSHLPHRPEGPKPPFWVGAISHLVPLANRGRVGCRSSVGSCRCTEPTSRRLPAAPTAHAARLSQPWRRHWSISAGVTPFPLRKRSRAETRRRRTQSSADAGSGPSLSEPRVGRVGRRRWGRIGSCPLAARRGRFRFR